MMDYFEMRLTDIIDWARIVIEDVWVDLRMRWGYLKSALAWDVKGAIIIRRDVTVTMKGVQFTTSRTAPFFVARKIREEFEGSNVTLKAEEGK